MSYLVIAQGTTDFEKEFATLEEAQAEVLAFQEAYCKENDIDSSIDAQGNGLDLFEISEDKSSFESAYSDHYQACFIRKKPEAEKEELQLLLDRADFGLTQYSFELVDTWTCRYFLEELRSKLSNA